MGNRKENSVVVMYVYSHAFLTCECGEELALAQRSFGNAAYTGDCLGCNQSFVLLRGKLAKLKKTVDGSVRYENGEPLTIDDVCAIVADHFGTNVEEIRSANRMHHICDARHTFVAILKEVSDLTHVEIGDYLSRNHSTITNSLYKFNALVEVDADFRTKYKSIISKLKSLKTDETDDRLHPD